jgi:drug/metabolite transporter (DMT)-like permease
MMTTARNTTALGTFYCTLSAVVYTAFYATFKVLSDKQDSAWITCVTGSIAAAILGVYLVIQSFRGRRVFPSWGELLGLAALGIVGQLGSVLTIWGTAIIGVGVTLVLQMGVMLAVAAILGRIVLGEAVFWKQIVAIVMVIVSVACFSMGSKNDSDDDAKKTATDDAVPVAADAAPSSLETLKNASPRLGIAAGILAGCAFATLGVGIRKVVTGETSPTATVFMINVMGAIALGPWCIYHLGLQTLASTPPDLFGIMLASGVLNLGSLLLVTMSFELISVVRVNVINNGLTGALTMIVGIFWFAERWNLAIGIGILLSLAGTLLISLADPNQNEVKSDNSTH